MYRISCFAILILQHSALAVLDDSGVVRNLDVTKFANGSGLPSPPDPFIAAISDSDSATQSNNVANEIKKRTVISLCDGNLTVPGVAATFWNVSPLALINQSVPIIFDLEPGLPFCGETAYILNVTDNNTCKFLPDGYLKIENDHYNTDEYCFLSAFGDEFQVRICKPVCSGTRPCLSKCLPPGDVLSYSYKRGVRSEVKFQPQFYENLPEKLTPVDSALVHPHYIRHSPKNFNCEDGARYLTYPFSEDKAKIMGEAEKKESIANMKFRARTDGRLFFETLDDNNCPEYREFPNEKVCVDGIQDVGQVKPFTNQEDEGVVFFCSLPSLHNAVFSLVLGIIMILSSSFLFLILIVYGLLWKQQNIHGWTVMGHTTSMFFAYILVGLTHIIGARHGHLIGSTYCYVHGVLTHFFFLSTFCWLTLISFDLWWTFRSITPAKKNIDKRLVIHACIGWGVPALVVLTSVGMDLAIGEQCTTLKLPKYGQKSCYVKPTSLGYYIYYPVGITLVLDVIFYCVTLFWLYHYKTNTHSVSKNNQGNRQLLTLFAKLFVVMGITWVFEFISWVHAGVSLMWFWAVVDCINVFQALAIFVIYVCKQDILDNLEKSYPFLSKHCLKYVRRGCRTERQETVEEDKDKTKASLLTCSNH